MTCTSIVVDCCRYLSRLFIKPQDIYRAAVGFKQVSLDLTLISGPIPSLFLLFICLDIYRLSHASNYLTGIMVSPDVAQYNLHPWAIIVLPIPLAVLSTIAISIRIWIRCVLARSFGRDDVCLIIAHVRGVYYCYK